MTAVGIEAMNVFAGTAYLDGKLAEHRNLDTTRFQNSVYGGEDRCLAL